MSNKLTNFQLKVLKLTEKIPLGKITTYGLLAQALGLSQAARAVGNALNKNPWAPQVPCHRVVKSDGQLGGYGGGAKRKLMILQQEGLGFDGSKKIKNFGTVLYKF